MVFREFGSEFSTPMAQSELIEEVKRCAEFPGQVDDITAADTEMALIIYVGCQREKAELGYLVHIQIQSCFRASGQRFLLVAWPLPLLGDHGDTADSLIRTNPFAYKLETCHCC